MTTLPTLSNLHYAPGFDRPHKLAGVTQNENGDPASRLVLIHREQTGELLAAGMSAADGAIEFQGLPVLEPDQTVMATSHDLVGSSGPDIAGKMTYFGP